MGEGKPRNNLIDKKSKLLSPNLKPTELGELPPAPSREDVETLGIVRNLIHNKPRYVVPAEMRGKMVETAIAIATRAYAAGEDDRALAALEVLRKLDAMNQSEELADRRLQLERERLRVDANNPTRRIVIDWEDPKGTTDED